VAKETRTMEWVRKETRAVMSIVAARADIIIQAIAAVTRVTGIMKMIVPTPEGCLAIMDPNRMKITVTGKADTAINADMAKADLKMEMVVGDAAAMKMIEIFREDTTKITTSAHVETDLTLIMMMKIHQEDHPVHKAAGAVLQDDPRPPLRPATGAAHPARVSQDQIHHPVKKQAAIQQGKQAARQKQNPVQGNKMFGAVPCFSLIETSFMMTIFNWRA